jgi:hypothetical protein
MFGQKMQVCMGSVRDGMGGDGTGLMTYGGISADQLALPAEPLALRYKRNAVALLVHRQIASVAKNDGIRIFAVAVIANCTFRVLLFSCASSFAIDSRRRAGSRSVRLRLLGAGFGNSYGNALVCVCVRGCSAELTFL